MINKYKLLNTIINLMIILILLVIPESQIIEIGWLFYLIQYSFFLYSIFSIKKNFTLFFSPSFLTLTYLSLNFVFGHYVVANGLGFEMMYHYSFLQFTSHKFIIIFFIICNYLVYTSLNFSKYREIEFKRTETNSKSINKVSFRTITFLFITFIISNFIKVDLAFLGGAGDFSYVIQLSIVIYLCYILASNKFKIRFLYYFLISILFVIGHYDSKREFLYVLILILFLELFFKNINFKFNIKQLVYGVLGFGFLLSIIVVASITRGYGNFEVKDPLEAVQYIPDYLQSDFATDALINNFELNTVYGNGSNALDYVYSEKVDLLYGSTFMKFLFIPLPRSVFPDKPKSMIDIYTTIYTPTFRKEGGSLPVILYSEAFWNFHLIGLLFIYLLYRFFDNMYRKMCLNLANGNITILSIFLIYLYITFIQVVRGSGFDIWILYPILSIPICYLILFLTPKDK